MIGLICKDMYCLKKNLVLFLGVTLGAIFIVILYILSSQYGNIAKGYEMVVKEGQMDIESLNALTKAVIYCSMILPLAFLGNIVDCFKEDWKAGFYKCMMSIPVSDAKKVGSRYVSCLLFAFIGMTGSIVAAFLVSLVAGDMPLFNSLKYILLFETFLLIYMSLNLFLLYWLGSAKADLIQCIPFGIVLLVVEMVMMNKISALPESERMKVFSDMAEQLKGIVNDYGYLLFLGALLCMGISFWGSWMMLKRRRGNV